MSRTLLEVAVAVRSPFVFQSLDPAAYGYHCSALRSEDGLPIIPGDHLRGHLRHALSKIAKIATNGPVGAQLIEILFGKESDEIKPDSIGEQNVPNRGRLIISDLRAMAVHCGSTECGVSGAIGTPYPRVKIDETTGAADDGMLQTIELVAPIDSIVVFRGEIVVRPLASPLTDIASVLNGALQLIPAMGALKSSGFGEIVHDHRTAIRSGQWQPAAPSAQRAGSDRLAITVAFDRPLLIDAQRTMANYFAGSTIVPGGAIKGALAEALKDAGCRAMADPDDETGKVLSQMIISHAFPLTETCALGDRAIPASLATVVETLAETDGAADEKIHIKDIIVAGALDELIEMGTPAFSTDWKREVVEEARARLNRPNAGLVHLPRGRVAIDAQTGVADEGKLFVVSPVGTTGRRWSFVLDRNDADSTEFAKVRDLILAGLDGIGATGARMTVVENGIHPEPPPPTPVPCLVGGKQAFVILLETPAVLTDPDDGRSPAEQYEDAFRSLSSVPDIQLDNHFARRSLYGRYLGFRFRAFGSDRYQPFEVTAPGAVFVIRPDPEGKFAAWLAQAARTGLPAILHRRTNGRPILDAVDSWRICPFVHQNGYGAITINPDLSSLSFG